MISDYAAQNACDLSVQKGQQVEIVNTECQGAPDFCLVRIIGGSSGKETTASSPSDAGSTLEGLVPVSILKPFPPQRRSGTSDSDVAAAGTDVNCDSALTNQSPANKRRGFSG